METRHLFISARVVEGYRGGRVAVAGIPVHFFYLAFVLAYTHFSCFKDCHSIQTEHLYETVMHFSHNAHTGMKMLRYDYSLFAVYTVPKKGKTQIDLIAVRQYKPLYDCT